jgi:hypothetical protein
LKGLAFCAGPLLIDPEGNDSGGFIRIFAVNKAVMKRRFPVLAFIVLTVFFAVNSAAAQCSICTKTAQQLGEKPAKGLNSGILYLAFMPLAIVGVISYKWWKNNKSAGA